MTNPKPPPSRPHRDEGATPTRPIRAPKALWDAFDSICTQHGTNRSARIREAMIEDIREHGGPAELALLEQAEAELAAARSRMHPGRPRKASGE